MNKLQLAKKMRVGARQIENYIAEGLPRRKAGRSWDYELTLCQAWVKGRKARPPHALREGTTTSARARQELAQAALLETKLARLRAELVPVDEVRKYDQRLAGLVRARLLAVPGRYAHRVQTARTYEEAQALLADAMREILVDLQEAMRNGDGSDGGSSGGRGTRHRGAAAG